MATKTAALRIYGTELVIGRLTGGGARTQLHLLNYSGREVDGMRVRVNGKYAKTELKAFGIDQSGLEDFVVADGATEFTIPRLGVYAFIELRP